MLQKNIGDIILLLCLILFLFNLKIISADIFKSLQSIVGDKNISKAEAVCSQHSHDESYYRCVESNIAKTFYVT